MEQLDTYIGIKPFTVYVDDSPELTELAGKARELRELPYQEKLSAVKELTISAMSNAYEQMVLWGKKADGLELSEHEINALIDPESDANKQTEKYFDIVCYEHPLSYALEQKAGCCRYQAALFFVLAYEADLGDKHFIHDAPVNRYVNTVFNELVNDGESDIVSIFTESLKNDYLDYSKQNPDVFEQANVFTDFDMYSYHRTPNGLVLIKNISFHKRELE